MATDLDAARQRVADLRAQVEQARRAQAAAEVAVAAELEAGQLAAEEARLQAQLDAAQTAADPAAIVASNANNLQAARDAMAVATGDVSASTDDENGGTAEKPLGVNLDTGEVLSAEESQAQYEQRASDAAETAANSQTDDFADVTQAVTEAVNAVSDPAGVAPDGTNPGVAGEPDSSGDNGAPAVDNTGTPADDSTASAPAATPANDASGDAGSEGGAV